jgi:hypothetical protein
VETDHPPGGEAPPIERGAAIVHYQLDISPLPSALIRAIEERFAPGEVRPLPDRVLIRTGDMDQASLRALLALIWDAGADLHALTPSTEGNAS